MAKEGLHFVVGAQKNKEGRIVLVKEEGAQLQAHAYFPEFERMQFSKAQSGVMLRAGKSRSQVREDIKDGCAFLRACAPAASKERLL
jgi:hypothetical protein